VERRPTAARRVREALRGLLTPHAVSREREGAERRAEEILRARDRLRRVEEKWKNLCGDADFLKRKRQLEGAKACLEGVKAVEEREWAELAARFREKRLPDHLRTVAIASAQLPGLGPKEVALLAGEGIAAAVDVTPERLMAIPHIDLELVRRLLLFRVAAARDYAFDPVTGIPGKDRQGPGGPARPAKGRAARQPPVRSAVPGRGPPPGAHLA
jgi:DNA-binding helix-hairpin-helix protein with protein kinase domain